MENENALLWEVTFWEFLIVTVLLGGGGAAMTGRALARGWQRPWQLVGSIVLLAGAVRFIHFALFDGTLIAPQYYLVDLVVLLVVAFAAMRATRAGQMAARYGFKFRRAGPFGWAGK